MRLLITGAAGFLGRAVAARAVGLPGLEELVLFDSMPAPVPPMPVPAGRARVQVIAGDFTDPEARRQATDGAHAILHLAAILGGQAEAAPTLARRVNLDATLDMFDEIRQAGRCPRVVFASSIAVLGEGVAGGVGADTPARPRMIYAAHKAMAELALSQASARGWLDGIALRPAGIVARPDADARLKTAFLSRVFHAIRDGQDIDLPVAPEGVTWLASAGCVAGNFLHALQVPGTDLGYDRALTLPALVLSFAELVAALRVRFPDSPARIRYSPDPEVMAAFGGFGPLDAGRATALGFAADRDAAQLVARALA